MKRREFIELSAASVGGLLIYSLAGAPHGGQCTRRQSEGTAAVLHRTEAKVIVAACERIFRPMTAARERPRQGPSCTSTGSWQARMALTGIGTIQAPFVDSAPEHGYQGKDNPQQTYRSGNCTARCGFRRVGWRRTGMSASPQSRKPTFFNCCASTPSKGCSVIRCTGGNTDLIGWQMLGYPGPQMSYAARSASTME